MYQITALTGLKRHESPPFSDVFPILGERISDTEFQYSDNKWKDYSDKVAALTHGDAVVAELADGLAMGDEEHGLIGISGEETVVEFTLGGFVER